jgi:Ala-tRNA(Pro) deacylase
MFLVTLRQETLVDLKKLSFLLGAGRFSFGSPERLWTHLGVLPGSVTPFAILNDHGAYVTLVLEAGMMAQEKVNFHPLINTMTIGLAPAELMTFLEKCGKTPHIIDLTAAMPD